jgi:hypothetical protein
LIRKEFGKLFPNTFLFGDVLKYENLSFSKGFLSFSYLLIRIFAAKKSNKNIT